MNGAATRTEPIKTSTSRGGGGLNILSPMNGHNGYAYVDSSNGMNGGGAGYQ